MVDSRNAGEWITRAPAWRGRGLESSATSPSEESPADWAPRSSGVDPVPPGPEGPGPGALPPKPSSSAVVHLTSEASSIRCKDSRVRGMITPAGSGGSTGATTRPDPYGQPLELDPGLRCQTGQQIRFQPVQLRGPSRVIYRDHQSGALAGHRPGIGSNGRPDDPFPISYHAHSGGVRGPPQLGHHPGQRNPDPLRFARPATASEAWLVHVQASRACSAL